MRAARSGTEEVTVLEASGEWFLDLVLAALSCSLGGSGSGVDAEGLRGKDVKARGALMADIMPPKAL